MLTFLLIIIPSKTELYSLTKPQLKLVADKIVIEFESKAELYQAILVFVEEDLIPEEQPPTSNSELEIR